MRKYKIGFMYFLATLLVVFVAGCGVETVSIPGVVSVTPAQGATNVAINATISATFNMAMSAASINGTTFTVAAPGGVAVSGGVALSSSGLVATFTPAGGNLAYNTTYTATITTGASTPGGAELLGDYAWSFTTAAPTALTVVVTPAPFANPVALSAPITATFSQAMNCASLATAFTVTAPEGDAPVTGTVTCSGAVATFTPAGGVLPSYGTTYTATITTGATDLTGFPLAVGNYVWTFTTIPTPPVITLAPTVTSTTPANGASGVPLNEQTISAKFSEPMNSGTIVLANFTLTGPGNTPVSGGSVAYAASGNSLVFTLPANLASGTTYTATISNAVTDTSGNALNGGIACASSTSGNCEWTFMTGSTTLTTPPELVSTVPGDTAPGVEATGVPLNQAVHATFTEAMNPLTLTTTTFLLYKGAAVSGTPLQATITYDPTTFIATLKPTALLLANTAYTATVTNGAMDVAGNPLGSIVPSPYTNPWTFTTGATTSVAPVVLGPYISQFGGFGGNAGMTNEGLLTVVNGNIGTTAASSLITGFHDTSLPAVGGLYPCTYTETTAPEATGQVNGVIDTAPGTSEPTAACPNEGTAATFAIATEAAGEALTAWNTLAAIPGGLDVSQCPGCGGGDAGELGNRTLAPGTYKSAPGSYNISAGPLTLDAKGDPNAYWVFQMASSLTVGAPTGPGVESVLLVNGAQASHVFWQVGSGAVINYGGGGTMVGTIIAYSGVTISSPGVATSSVLTTLDGRALGLDASVTVVNTIINTPPAP
jgi:hypothetical protein